MGTRTQINPEPYTTELNLISQRVFPVSYGITLDHKLHNVRGLSHYINYGNKPAKVPHTRRDLTPQEITEIKRRARYLPPPELEEFILAKNPFPRTRAVDLFDDGALYDAALLAKLMFTPLNQTYTFVKMRCKRLL